MAILMKGSCAALLLWGLSMLSLRNVLASSSYGYTLTMPFNSMQMYGDRTKRSLATICVEIKPNGPLEEPYYMCKGADFPQFPKLSNTATPNYGSTTGNSDTSVQHSASHFAQNNYNGAAFDKAGGADSTSGTNFQGYSNKFATGSTDQSAHSHLESQMSVHQQSKQISSTDTANTQVQSHHNAGARTFQEQTSARTNFQRPTEYQQQFQRPLQQQQQQHHYQQQVQQQQVQQQQFQHNQQQFQQNQQLTSTQQGTNFQPFFQKTEQFFRPSERSESNAGKINTYENFYSEKGSEAVSKANGGFIPSASFGAQHSTSFNTPTAEPTYPATSTAAAAGSSGSSLASHTNQRFESSQYPLLAAADCGEDCGKPVSQTASSSGATQNGATQYAATYTSHSTGYDTQNSKSFVAGGVTSQLANAHSTASASITSGDEQNSPPVPSTNYSPADIARTSDASSLRYRGNGASAFTAPDGPPVSHVGSNDTPPLGSAFLRPTSNAAYYSNEPFSSDALLGGSIRQAAHRQHIDAQHKQKNFFPTHHQNHFAPMPRVPPAQRYRTTIDDEVLKMPNWGFSTDELDFYRTKSGEKEDNNSELTGMAIPTPTPPRLIPLEYLEDPVMRAFYSSLDDVGPLPAFSPVYPAQRPSGYAHPPPRRMSYQPPVPSCAYSPVPQYYNYNPCPPQREYSFQPVFIALPCYGQSLYPGLGSPAPAAVTGNPMPQVLTSTQTQTAIQTPTLQSQSEVRSSSTSDAASKSESRANIDSAQIVSKKMEPKRLSTTTVATTTIEDSNESGESLEDSTTTAAKVSQPSTKNDGTGSAEAKLTSSEKPTIVKFDTNLPDLTKTTAVTPNSSGEKVGAAISASTPPPVDSVGGQMETEMSTTFKSLILTARKLAQMVTTSQEEDDMMYKDEAPTPKPAPKKVRHAGRSSSNGSGGNKRRFSQ